jgi:hypothetical protein
MKSLDVELVGPGRAFVLAGLEPPELEWDLGEARDADDHGGSTIGVRCRGIAVGIRSPLRLLESGFTVDEICYR